MREDVYQLRKDIDNLIEKYNTLSLMQVAQESTITREYINNLIDEKITNNTASDNDISYRDLLQSTQDFKELSDDMYTLFRGDCWTINNNFESSASVTSVGDDDLTVTGTFRTVNDLIGLYWNSKDPIQHPYISYGSRSNYEGVVLDFDYDMWGCMDFSDGIISITIGKNNGSIYYLTMNRFIEDNHVHIEFSNLTLLPGNSYINANGQSITVTEETSLAVDDIKYIMFVIVPEEYVENNSEYTIMSNVHFNCEITNIEVQNGDICNEHKALNPHPYRLCEGYDDFYDLNPKRVCHEMRKLGYVEWCDLYIGASHFYEKSGTVDDVIDATDFNHTRTEKMVLDQYQPLNRAFIAWLDCYSRELLANECPNLVVSVSMENLQCPTSWRQVDCNGNYAITGWIPSTFFYSPCNYEVIEYMKYVSADCLSIVTANGLTPILQMGEAWWWWNENDRPAQPPCFYDNATKNAYYAEFGRALPEYSRSWNVGYDEEDMYWLNQQLCNYSDELRSVVKDNYNDGLYMALFFPPSVVDTDRVPSMMREVNYIQDAYNPNKLDVLQIEDYDWVIWESPHHEEAYMIGQDLGFKEDRLHYFGGFVQYPEDAKEYWPLIQDSMEEAFRRGFQEVFVWAGSQVRRDNKVIGYDEIEFIQQILH